MLITHFLFFVCFFLEACVYSKFHTSNTFASTGATKDCEGWELLGNFLQEAGCL